MTDPPAPPSSGKEAPSQLMARVGRGDRDALTRFYRRCVDGLYAFVFYRVGRDAGMAEDVVQETFLLALDRTEDYDEARGSLRSWLCQLSRNVMRKHLKLRKSTQSLALWERLDESLARAFARIEREALASEVLERHETHDLVYVAMGHLPDPYRHVLEQKYVAERSLSELSSELGISEDAVKSLLARARRAFREAFHTLSAEGAERYS